MLLVVWVGSHCYIKGLEMYKYEALGDKIYNPYTVYAYGPFEEVTYQALWIPLLNSIHSLMDESEMRTNLKTNIDKLEKWLKLGYIPKSDFPEHLKKYYVTKKEKRL